MRTMVTEFKVVSEGHLKTAARFVLLPSATVEVVPLSFTREAIDGLLPDPLPSQYGEVTKSDGLAYLNALRDLYHGDYFWATDPFEMDLDEALGANRQTGN
jgi:hypothetical protein